MTRLMEIALSVLEYWPEILMVGFVVIVLGWMAYDTWKWEQLRKQGVWPYADGESYGGNDD